MYKVNGKDSEWNRLASQSCAIANSEQLWWTVGQSNLAYKRMAVTKASKSFVFVLTQLYYGQWSSLPFCLPSPVACQNCSHLANAGGCETGFKPKQLFAGWRCYHSNLAVIPLQWHCKLFATERVYTQISPRNEGFVCSYQLFQFRNSPKQNAPQIRRMGVFGSGNQFLSNEGRVFSQISHRNEGFVCSYQLHLFQFRNSPKQNAS